MQVIYNNYICNNVIIKNELACAGLLVFLVLFIIMGLFE